MKKHFCICLLLSFKWCILFLFIAFINSMVWDLQALRSNDFDPRIYPLYTPELCYELVEIVEAFFEECKYHYYSDWSFAFSPAIITKSILFFIEFWGVYRLWHSPRGETKRGLPLEAPNGPLGALRLSEQKWSWAGARKMKAPALRRLWPLSSHRRCTSK